MWPEDQTGAGLGGFRASDADRERTVDSLKTAFVEGRLGKDALDAATGRALGARTYAELGAIMAAVPARLASTWPAEPPRAAVVPRKPVNKKLVALGTVIVVVPVAVWATLLTYYGGFIIMFIIAFFSAAVVSVPPTSEGGPPASRHWW